MRALTLEEDRALRKAFGRFAVPAAQAAGMAVVQRCQHAGAGHWFACSCLGPGVRPPVLVPVAEAHLRRRQDPPWPAHAAECDFYRDPDEQRLVTRSYARPRRGDLVRLVGKLKAEETPSLLELRSRSYARARGALATLLAEILVRAGLNRIGPDGSVPAIAEQFRALRAAAREVPIERDVPLSEFLCTYAPVLPELLGKVERTAPARFRRTRRPHGVLLAVVSGVSQGRLTLLRVELRPVLRGGREASTQALMRPSCTGHRCSKTISTCTPNSPRTSITADMVAPDRCIPPGAAAEHRLVPAHLPVASAPLPEDDSGGEPISLVDQPPVDRVCA